MTMPAEIDVLLRDFGGLGLQFGRHLVLTNLAQFLLCQT